MKKIVLLLLAGCSIITAPAPPCCKDNQVLKPRGLCGPNNETMYNLNCTSGKLVLRDAILDGDKVSTLDTPNYVFVEDPNLYCLGDMYRNNSLPELGTTRVAIVCWTVPAHNDGIETTGIFPLLSVVFLVATVAFYAYFPELRDLQGLCYMSMCSSMALGFLSLGVLQLSPGFRGVMCTITGFVVYMWMMATFFWMNVICVNVYRTVMDSEYLKKTEKKQYLIYSGYAWGCTLFFLMVTVITNLIEGDHYKPGFGEGSCWFKGRVETWLFFYGPIAVLVTVNVLLFILSSYHLWRQTRKYQLNQLNNLKYKFLLSLKLLLVMGISWIFEIASFAHNERLLIWKIMDMFNCLQGVIIFILLVVLRKRVMQALVRENCCLFVTRRLADTLNPHDDSDDQHILAEETVEVRLH